MAEYSMSVHSGHNCSAAKLSYSRNAGLAERYSMGVGGEPYATLRQITTPAAQCISTPL